MKLHIQRKQNLFFHGRRASLPVKETLEHWRCIILPAVLLVQCLHAWRRLERKKRSPVCLSTDPTVASLQDKWIVGGNKRGRSLLTPCVVTRLCVCVLQTFLCQDLSTGRPPAQTGLAGLRLRGPGFLFLMQTTRGFEAALGISSDCKHRLFNLDSRLKMDLVFWEVLCRYSWNLIPPQRCLPVLLLLGRFQRRVFAPSSLASL